MKYKLAVFDMDGTILDTLEDLTNSLNNALELSGYQKRSITEVCSFVGNGIPKLIERGAPNGTASEQLNKLYEDFTAHYKVHCTDNTKPYVGITDAITNIRQKGIKTAVVSNKSDFAVQDLIRQYFDGMFDIAEGERPEVRKKPAPDLVNSVLSKLQIDKSDAVYIGDSGVDIQTAKNAGMDCISVSWGFRTKEFLKENGAAVIISKPEDLLKMI